MITKAILAHQTGTPDVFKYEDYETIIHHIHDYWTQSELYYRQ